MKRHIISGCQEFPSDIDYNAIFSVSDPVEDAHRFMVDLALTRDFINKF
jgi:hypothetical protein